MLAHNATSGAGFRHQNALYTTVRVLVIYSPSCWLQAYHDFTENSALLVVEMAEAVATLGVLVGCVTQLQTEMLLIC